MVGLRLREGAGLREVLVCKEAELPDGSVRIIQATPNEEIGVYCHKGQYFAYRNRCVHQGGPVCEGEIVPRVEDVLGPDKTWLGHRFVEDDYHIVCPWHAYEFELTSGVCAADPKIRLKRFEVATRDGEIYVLV
jgi:nitrite reductase (NADH) small subunit